ncbi:LysR family transcriptional regulator [Streptomyces sp. SID3212]|uniref:LysR family transcriptional regulator n=1 Tax=Streptomyces sp. SID3212 TaxID=2690259 RepID=UPI0013683C16|nr:LysR family transcriptional regulator [Streptomyces sp. SID3212]MYV50961.1 LysR family transcriptional regulator [Streptomyces sp. SID3212]
MLDVRRMQVLMAVVSSGSVTGAAAHLGYTPSAVSQQVAALEKQAGIALLERVGRGVRPTAAGRLLTEHAATISRNVAEAETALAELRAGRTGRLAIRYFATAGASLVAPAVARFRAEHPGVRIDLRLSDPGDPLAEVTEGRADLALMISPQTPPNNSTHLPHVPHVPHLLHLRDDAYAAVLPAGHRLADRDVLDLADLADEPWVGSEPPGPCLEPVLTACAAAGFTPDFVVESGDYATAQGFVAAGLGIGLMPLLGVGPGTRHPGVVVREVRNPQPVRAICAAVRDLSLTEPAPRALVEALREAAGASAARPV